MTAPEMELLESTYVADVFADRLAKVERIGPCVRLIFAVPDSICGSRQISVVARLVLPVDCLADVAQLLAATFAERMTPQPNVDPEGQAGRQLN